MHLAAVEIDADAVRRQIAAGQRRDARQPILPALHVKHPAPVMLDRKADVGARHGEPPHDVEAGGIFAFRAAQERSEEHTSELQSLMRLSYAVFCLKKKNTKH